MATVRVLQAALLLVVAGTLSLSTPVDQKPVPCEFFLDQGMKGEITRLRVGSPRNPSVTAFVQQGTEYGQWRGYVLNNDSMIYSDNTGKENATSYDNLSIGARRMLDRLVNQELHGIKLFSQDRQILGDFTENSVTINYQENEAYRFSDKRNYATVYVRGDSFNYAHIFYQNNSAVTLVNEECNDARVMKLNLVDASLQHFLLQKMRF